MRKMEVLAPVGGQEQLIAAVRCGADAVYLGAKGFNARRNAENFAQDGLRGAVTYCHARGVRVYVTVNTLVMDDELPAVLDTLREVADSGADAIIVQDLAVAALARERCPGLALHASTQMTIHNAEGAGRLRALGFSRVVLARELSIPEIAAIAVETDIELEAFVHGALCVGVSGACYLSSMLGGRSGNRGLCAQPCRLDFDANGRGHALSLKDLSALGHLEALGGAGIQSLKIEGRMKRPEYVAAAVTACRQALAGEPYDLATLEAAFSRGGFTDGHLTGRRNASMFGTRTREDVQASQRVQKQLAALYRHERAAIPVDMVLTLRADTPATLTVTDGTRHAEVTGDAPQVANASPTDEARARRSLQKTGESPFCLRDLTVSSDGTLMLPAASMNALRRDALQRLLAMREAPRPLPFLDMPLSTPAPHTPDTPPALRLRFEHAGQLPDDTGGNMVILPIDAITGRLIGTLGDRLIGEIPALVFPDASAQTAATLRALRAQGLSRALCHNLGAIGMAQDAGLTAHGGYGLNILGTLALEAYARMGLADTTVSFELHARKIELLGGTLPRGAVAYGLLPLMQLRACPARGEAGCGACDGQPRLTDRTGAAFTLLCNGRRYATLLNTVPLSLSGEALPGVDFMTLRFTTESPAECARVIRAFREGAPPEGSRTRGLYRRTLQ